MIIAVFVITLLTVHAWSTSSKLNFKKKMLQTIALPFLFDSFSTNILPVHAIDALDAAKDAMLVKKEKVLSERSVDSLPPAAKKRKALAICKDSASLKAAGYLTSAKCTSDVIDGNYDKILNADKEAPVLPTKSLSSQSSLSTSIPKAESTTFSAPSVASSTQTKVSSTPKEKVLDLSSLPPAAKKRRALAACKKSDTRKFAQAGSESKCTEKVLQGDYNSIINALEYGK